MSAATATASGGAAGNGGMGTTDPESHYGHDGVSYLKQRKGIVFY